MQLFAPVLPKANGTGIGLSLTALVMVAIVPLLVFGSGVAWLIVDQKKQDIADELRNTTRALSVAVDRELISQFIAMEILATDDSLDTPKLAEFNRKAHQIIRGHGDWRNIVLIDPTSHTIVAGSLEIPSPPPLTLAPQAVDAVLSTRKPVVAGVFPSGKLAPGPMIAIMVPVIRGDSVRFILALAINAMPISRIFVDQSLPASWTGAIVDNRMMLAGRSRDPERYIGVRATPSLAERIAASERGMFTALNQEGQTVYTVFSRSSATGWSVVIGVPASEVEGPIRHLLWQLAGAGGALMAFALALAALVGRIIVRNRNALSNSESRYRSLFASSQVVMLVIDPDNDRIVDANAAACAYYGYALEALKSMSILDINTMPPEQVNAEIRRAKTEEKNHFTFHHRLANGELRDVEVFSGPIEIGGRKLLLSIIIDVTERKQAEETVKVQELKYRLLFETANDGIFLQDETGFIDCNQRGANMYGCQKEDLIGRSPADFAPERQPDGRLSSVVAAEKIQAALQGKPQLFEWQPLRIDRSPFDVEITLSRIQIGTSVYLQAIVRDITERKKLEAELRELATTDPLTGLPNRRHFIDRLEEELARVLRLEGQNAAVLMLDLDHFKQVNDTYGHAVGDALLKHFAALLREGLRKIDTGGRVGGEEFAIILPGADLAAARVFAERLRRKVAETPATQENQIIPMTVSIGISAVNASDASPDAALLRADEALYRAKNAGRNRVEVAE
ncbi:MAG: diguanylate cyclase [Sterolibacterium sp.]